MTDLEAQQLAQELREAKLAEISAGVSARSLDQPVEIAPLLDRPPTVVCGYFTQ